MINSTYSDFDFDFESSNSYGVAIETDVAAINQSIMNILLTRKGEVPFDPLFGSSIFQMLFEKISFITERLIEEEIKSALGNYEPRITITDISIIGDPTMQTYDVRIEYIINFLSTTGVFQASLALQGI